MARVKKEKPIPQSWSIDVTQYDSSTLWYYNNEPLLEVPANIIGFVYVITNTTNNRKYIGKKNFFTTKTRQVNKKPVKSKVFSDFMDYYGSNDAIKSDVITLGKEKFHREILVLCDSKSMMSYWEAKYQFHYDVTLSDEKWYNSWIMVRVNANHLKPHHYNHILRENL